MATLQDDLRTLEVLEPQRPPARPVPWWDRPMRPLAGAVFFAVATGVLLVAVSTSAGWIAGWLS